MGQLILPPWEGVVEMTTATDEHETEDGRGQRITLTIQRMRFEDALGSWREWLVADELIDSYAHDAIFEVAVMKWAYHFVEQYEYLMERDGENGLGKRMKAKLEAMRPIFAQEPGEDDGDAGGAGRREACRSRCRRSRSWLRRCRRRAWPRTSARPAASSRRGWSPSTAFGSPTRTLCWC